ncbi:MAG: glycosyltransferase [Clostridia bacterium]|nr:glycosyltransferase [Clostridia bacterium]
MKKILFILPSLCVGGLERMQVTLANALVARGYDVTVMTLLPERDLADELDEKVKFIYKPYKPHPIMSRIPYVRYKFYDDGMWEGRASAETLYEYYVGDEKYDVEIAFFRGLPVKIISGSTNEDAVKLAWVHSDFRKRGIPCEFRDAADMKGAYAKFDKVVCVSGEAKIGFVEALGDTDNLTTIYNTIPVDEILEKAKAPREIDVKKGGFHIVLVGHLLDKVKGQTRLISAVTRLREEGFDLSLALIGGGDDYDVIKKAISDRGADGYITMTGNLKNPYPYIKDADLLVCASYFEGYNLTVAEALALGTPAMSTRCAGPVEILGDGEYGMIVENSEEGLYGGLKKLLREPELLKNYREKAARRREFFDGDTILGQITELFG